MTAKIGILTPVLAANDAVGNDVMTMHRVLGELGADVRIFADARAGVEQEVGLTEDLPRFCSGEDAMVICHYSVGWARGLELVDACQAKKVLKYHNVTPPEFFEPYCGEYTAVCRAGREELPRAAGMSFDLFLGDSAYNAGELVGAGAPPERTGVVPPFHHVSEMADVDADLPFLDRFKDGFNVLMVGRIAPNKDHPALVEAFADFQRNYRRDARLLIVGKSDARLSGYNRKIEAAIRGQGVSGSVFMLGGVNLSELKAAYLCADVFMIMSKHEGFCVPVVEAMSMGVPILGCASSAVPGTVDDGGILWESDDSAYYSESLRELAMDRDLRIAIGERGRARFERVFKEEQIRKSFLEQLARIGFNA
jgi:glycosyltransferase involved in cell wall biosynthesis